MRYTDGSATYNLMSFSQHIQVALIIKPDTKLLNKILIEGIL
jgi:hypothetical protein